jgi:drug/metabolite transporter (DMT)-like permease
MGLSPLSLYALVLLSAVAHAAWNSLVKSASDRLLMMGAIRLVGLTYGLVMLPFVPRPSAVTCMWLAFATAAVFAYYGLLIQSYRIGDMSLVYPIARGSAPILLALIAFLTIDERLSSRQIAAVTLTSAGILMLVVGKGGDRIAIALAIATGISIAAYSFFGALGVRASAEVLGFQAWLEILTGIGMVSFIAIRRGCAIGVFIRVHYTMVLLAGVLSVAGYLAYLAAAQILPLGPVSALRESSVIFGTVIGAIALREGFAARRIAAAIMVTSGVVALALAGSR